MRHQFSRVILAKLNQQASARPKNQLRGKQNWVSGNAGQNVIEDRLRHLGVLMVETISVGWNVKFKTGTRQPISAYPLKKVSGDVRGVLQGGRSVLCEVKRTGDRLCFSDLRDNQVESLDAMYAAGGLALLGFVWTEQGGGSAVMEWPVPGFVPGKSISIEYAKMRDITFYLKDLM